MDAIIKWLDNNKSFTQTAGLIGIALVVLKMLRDGASKSCGLIAGFMLFGFAFLLIIIMRLFF